MSEEDKEKLLNAGASLVCLIIGSACFGAKFGGYVGAGIVFVLLGVLFGLPDKGD